MPCTVFVVDDAVAITLSLPKFEIDTLQFDNVKVYPDAVVKVPEPDTVATENVVFAPIVKVYPELTDKVPAPAQYASLEDVVIEAPTVRV